MATPTEIIEQIIDPGTEDVSQIPVIEGNVVHITGTETITGLKTFSQIEVVSLKMLGDIDMNGFDLINWSGGGGGGGGVPTSRQIIAGAGMTGGGTLAADRTLDVGAGDGIDVSSDAISVVAGAGITVDGDGVALTQPGSLSVSSSNSSIGAADNRHTHAISASSSPAAVSSLLKTDSSGYLQLVRLGIGVAPTQPLHVAGNIFVDASTANLFLKDTSTGFKAAATGVVNPQSGNDIRNISYTSGLNGWHISDTGNAEFNNVIVRGELRASVFKVNEIAATAGTFGVFFSATTVQSDFTTPASLEDSFSFDAKNSEVSHGMLLGVGEIIRIKALGNSGGLIIADVWAIITGRTSHTTYATYTATLKSGSTAATIPAGTAIVDYGLGGTGFITLSSDGTIGASPNMTMATHDGSPWDGFSTLLRIGNLNGSYGYAFDAYGVGIGQYGEVAAPWLIFDTTEGIRIGHNTTVLAQWDISGNILIGQEDVGQSNVYITSGAVHLRNNLTDKILLDSAGAIVVGEVGASKPNITIDTTNGVRIRNNTTVLGQWDTSGNVLIGQTGASQSNVYISGGAVKIRNNATDYISLDSAGVALFGITTSSQGNVLISGGTVSIRRGTTSYITLNATDAQFTNLIKMSGASAAISLGSTPPTSATVGTGIWIDRTGLYALSSSTQHATVTSAGIAAGTHVLLNSSGLTLGNGGVYTANATLKWFDAAITPFSSNNYGELYAYSSTGFSQISLRSGQHTGTASGNSLTQLLAVNNLGKTAQFDLISEGSAYAFGNANNTLAILNGDNFIGIAIGSGTQPTHMLEVTGTVYFSGNVDYDGVVSTYNGVATAGVGMPSIYGVRDIAARDTGFGPVTVITPAVTGFYRITATLKISTAGTSPVAGPITITYNDGDGNVAQSHVMALASTTGTLVTTTVNNSTTTGTVSGSLLIYAHSGTDIAVSVGVSGTFGAGKFTGHIRCEAL